MVETLIHHEDPSLELPREDSNTEMTLDTLSSLLGELVEPTSRDLSSLPSFEPTAETLTSVFSGAVAEIENKYFCSTMTIHEKALLMNSARDILDKYNPAISQYHPVDQTVSDYLFNYCRQDVFDKSFWMTWIDVPEQERRAFFDKIRFPQD